LNIQDIPGAKPGTLISQVVKNKAQAQRFRDEEEDRRRRLGTQTSAADFFNQEYKPAVNRNALAMAGSSALSSGNNYDFLIKRE
jgi:hypothetical protein